MKGVILIFPGEITTSEIEGQMLSLQIHFFENSIAVP